MRMVSAKSSDVIQRGVPAGTAGVVKLSQSILIVYSLCEPDGEEENDDEEAARVGLACSNFHRRKSEERAVSSRTSRNTLRSANAIGRKAEDLLDKRVRLRCFRLFNGRCCGGRCRLLAFHATGSNEFAVAEFSARKSLQALNLSARMRLLCGKGFLLRTFIPREIKRLSRQRTLIAETGCHAVRNLIQYLLQ